jgi:hypothetical protein
MLEEALTSAVSLAGTPGQEYVERRGIPLGVAEAAGVRFASDWGGRPAVIVGLYDRHGVLTSVHGRYFHVVRGQDKMRTIGPGGGAIGVLGGWRIDPLIIVEGLFDALSLAVCGYACVATIGRPVPWLPEITAGRSAWIGFDNSRSGDESASPLLATLPGASDSATRPFVGLEYCSREAWPGRNHQLPCECTRCEAVF